MGEGGWLEGAAAAGGDAAAIAAGTAARNSGKADEEHRQKDLVLFASKLKLAGILVYN